MYSEKKSLYLSNSYVNFEKLCLSRNLCRNLVETPTVQEDLKVLF